MSLRYAREPERGTPTAGRAALALALLASVTGCLGDDEPSLAAVPVVEQALAGSPSTPPPTAEPLDETPLESAVVTADTYVRTGPPNRNHGAEAVLKVTHEGKERSLVHVADAALAAVVQGRPIESAILELTIEEAEEDWRAGEGIAAHRVTMAWTEGGATWRCANDTQPQNQQTDCATADRWQMKDPPHDDDDDHDDDDHEEHGGGEDHRSPAGGGGGAGQRRGSDDHAHDDHQEDDDDDDHGPWPRPWGEPASASVTIVEGQTGTLALDVTADLQGFLAGTYANHGWLLKKLPVDSDGRLTLASRETAHPPVLRITIADIIPPRIHVDGVADGEHRNTDATITFSATDESLASVSATLNGAPFASGALVSSEGSYTLVVTASDVRGNTATESRSFVIDKTAPAITIAGVTDGEHRNIDAVVTFEATDPYLASASATLNGAAFTSGATVSAEGAYTLIVTATDQAGNTASETRTFVIDKTPPVITAAGVVDGEIRNTDATITYSATDAALASVEASLNGAAFVSGTTVSLEGSYTLVVTAVDQAGNTASETRAFIIDKTPPVITIAGVIEGEHRNTDAVPTFAAQDLHLDSVSATLDGAPFTTGTAVSIEGPHSLTVTATDAAGNVAHATRSFVIDKTPPAITITGVTDGEQRNTDATIIFDATDPYLASLAATLNGVALTNGATVSAEGTYTLVVTATDQAGNTATQSRTFVIDKTLPVITVAGVVDGENRNTDATITYQATDAALASATATLNGASFTSGTTVPTEGAYTLVVTATDQAGNTATESRSFVIDKTAPAITIAGVTDGEHRNIDAIVTFEATDLYLASASATLNGAAFTSGATVSAEGTYTLIVTATDQAGNTASETRTFVIDKTPPVITVAGVVDGEIRNTDATITYSATDAALASVEASLNGAAFVSGTTVSLEGGYTLVVTATDQAGNIASETRTFVIDKTPPAILVEGVLQEETRNTDATLTYAADDLHLAEVSATLDGAPFTSGGIVTVEGAHTLVVTASDAAGNTARETRVFTLDKTPPSLSIQGVADGEHRRDDVVITYSATDDRLASVTATLDGAPFASGAAVSVEGVHTLVVTAADAAGNRARETRVFTLDKTPPALTLTGVIDGEVRNTDVAISYDATDTYLSSVSATLNGGAFASGELVSDEGSYSLVVTAADLAGNTATETRTFIIDKTPPSLSISSPADGYVTSQGSVEIVAAVTDAVGVAEVRHGVELAVPGADGSYRVPAFLLEGNNVLTLTATDVAGNPSTASVMVVRDTRAPALTVTSPTKGARIGALSVLVTGTAFDSTALTVEVSGQPAPLAADGTFQVTAPLVSGDNTLTISATDAAGLVSVTTVDVRANDTPPTVVVTAPVEGASLPGPLVDIEGTALPGDPADAPSSLVVTVAGNPVTLGPDGSFQRTLPFPEGPRAIEVSATDSYGLRTVVTRNVTLVAGTPDAGPSPSDGGVPSADAGPTPATDAGAEIAPVRLVLDRPASGLITSAATVAFAGRVEGGQAPFAVTVNGLRAAVVGRDFSLALSLAEGTHDVPVVVTDGRGDADTATRQVVVDRTPPFLELTRPTANPATVSESPYLLQGSAADPNLASVTVDGAPVSVIGGGFQRSFSLPLGDTSVLIEARDAAGNRSSLTQTLTLTSAAPVVTIVSPQDGFEAAEAFVEVQVQVSAVATVTSVFVGPTTATEVGAGLYSALVPLALGDNTLRATAVDANGVSGSDAVLVRYKDPAQEPLEVTRVEPAHGTKGVETDQIVVVYFNKHIDRASVPGNFTLLVDGTPLEGGLYIAPGEQAASFIARSPLPVSATVAVRVDGVLAKVGPALASPFTSDFEVRPALTSLQGVVMDADFLPLAGVRVSVVGQNVSTTTLADGNWALFGVKPGLTRVRYEGGLTSDGRRLPSLERSLFVTAGTANKERPLLLVPVDDSSAAYVDATTSGTAAFAGGATGVTLTYAAGGLALKDGSTHGLVTATSLPALAVPYPVQDGLGPTVLWQLGPDGVRFTRPVELAFPNATGLPAGRRVIVLAFSPSLETVLVTGLGRVSAAGDAVVPDEPLSVPSLDVFGYVPLNAEQHALLEASLQGGGTGTGGAAPSDGGMGAWLFSPLEGMHPVWEELLSLFSINEAHAQNEGLGGGSLGNAALPLQQLNQSTIPAAVSGVVKAAYQPRLLIDVANLTPRPQGDAGGGALSLPITLELSAQTTTSDPGYFGATQPQVRFALDVTGTQGEALFSPEGAGAWESFGAGTASLESGILLEHAGTYRITFAATPTDDTANLATGAKFYVAEVRETTPGSLEYEVLITDAGETNQTGEPLQQDLTFDYVPVTFGANRFVQVTTNASGVYSTQLSTFGGVIDEISIAELELGTLSVPRRTASGDVRAELVSGVMYAQSPTYSVGPGDVMPRADILVDARLLRAYVKFVGRDGAPLPPLTADSAETMFDPVTGELLAISTDDVGTTEVHFFREADLDQALVKMAVVAPNVDGVLPKAGVHGVATRLRIGPKHGLARSGSHTEDRRDLAPGERVVVFAVNHATGYAGMKTVTIPPRDRLYVDVDVPLFPPEVEVRVERNLSSTGVQRPDETYMVRHGGMATSQDNWLRVSTRWRVRKQVGSDPGLTIPDAGPVPECDAGVGPDGGACEPRPIYDEGVFGEALEVACSELSPAASAEERARCLLDDTVLSDVPAGVPPLAAQIVPVAAGAAQKPIAHFTVPPGHNTSWVDPAIQIVDGNGQAQVVNLDVASYYVHIVGRRVAPRDLDGDGVLNTKERDTPAPNFAQTQAGPAGLPDEAIALKNVYRAIRPGDHTRAHEQLPLFFDRAREHEFRVISVEEATVIEHTDGASREMDTEDPNAEATEGATSYEYLLSLLEPGDPSRAQPGAGEYTVRFGGDALGIDCTLNIEDNGATSGLTADCGDEWVPAILSAHDVVYLELYLSGNAENVLHRFNFYGLMPRLDHPAVNSTGTSEKVTLPKLATGERAPRTPVSRPNIAFFFLDPREIQSGTVRLCASQACDDVDDPLKILDIESYDQSHGTYAVVERAGGRVQAPVEQTTTVGVGEARYFMLPLPPDLAAMPGSGNIARRVSLRVDPAMPTGAATFSRDVGIPRGGFDSAAATPAGQMVVGGVDVADGHLVRQYDDLVVPEKGITRRFSRTYNNQRNEISSLGVGWMHNYEGYIHEEEPGRYQVVLEGQAYDFPTCQVTRGASGETLSVARCETDKAHGGKLELSISGSAADPANYTTFVGRFQDGAGTTYTFDRLSAIHKVRGDRRYLLTRIDDALQEDIILEYADEANGADVVRRDWVRRARRTGGISFELDYEPIDTGSGVHFRLAAAVRLHGLKRLASVRAYFDGAETTIAELMFDHDVSTSPVCVDSMSSAPSAPAASMGLVLNLLGACRSTRYSELAQDTGAPVTILKRDLRTTYVYAPPVTGGSFALLNELSAETLESLQPVQSVAFRASYERGAATFPYPHLLVGELVTKMNLPGEPYEVEYETPTLRMVTWPMGDRLPVTLNPYGSPTSVETPCGTSRTSWGSDDDNGQVVLTSWQDPRGFSTHVSYDERLRPLRTWLTALPSAVDLRPVAGLSVGNEVSVSSYDEATGLPLATMLPGAGRVGGRAQVTTELNANGFVVGQSTPNGPSWSQPVDANGLPSGPGSRTDGNRIDWYGQESQEFGQPVTVHVTCDACASTVATTGGRTAQVTTRITTNLVYDGLGRISKVIDVGAAEISEVEYDGLGRVVRRVVRGGPDEVWTYSYQLTEEGDYVTTAEVVREDGRPHQISTVSRRGLARTSMNELGETTSHEYDDHECAPARMVVRDRAGVERYEIRHVPSSVPNVARVIEVYEEGVKKSEVGVDLLGRTVATFQVDENQDSVLELDTFGNVVAEEYGDDHHIFFDLDDYGRVEAILSDPAPRHARQEPKKAALSLEIDQRDAAGRVKKQTYLDPSTVQEFDYDVRGRVVREVRTVRGFRRNTAGPLLTTLKAETVIEYVDGVRPRKKKVHYFIESPDGNHGNRTITIEVDDDGRQTRVEDDSAVVTFRYDEDAAQNVTEIFFVTESPPGSGQVRRGRQEIDRDGTIRVYDGELSTTPIETQTFYASGRLHKKVSETPPRYEEFTYDGAWERERYIRTLASDEYVKRSFDDRGRILFEEHGLPGAPVTYRLDNSWNNYEGRLVTEIRRADPTGDLTLELRRSGQIDGNGNLSVGVVDRTPSGGDVAELVTYHDASGAPIDSSTVGDELRNYAPPNEHLPWLRLHVDGSATVIGRASWGDERSIVVPATYWPTEGCALESAPPDVVHEAILKTFAGNYTGMLELLVENQTSTGELRCDLLGIARFAGELQFDINRRKFNEYAASMAPNFALEAVFFGAGTVVRALVARLILQRALRQAAGGVIRRACFVAGTLVFTADGMRPIEEVKVGDSVWSKDEATGREGWAPVVRTFVTEDKEVLRLKLIREDDGRLEVLGTTAEHPFWAEGKGWVPAGKLAPGDRVPSAHGGWLRVGSSTWTQERETVYNFEVEGTHTYFVGESGAWVHNTCGVRARVLANIDASRAARAASNFRNSGSVVDDVIEETLRRRGNFGSAYTLRADDALEAGARFLGPGYREMGGAGSGVFRSADGLRQFRIDLGSITGSHGSIGGHVHLERLNPLLRGRQASVANNHIPFFD